MPAPDSTPFQVAPRIAGEALGRGSRTVAERENPADAASTVTVTVEASVEDVGSAVAAARAAFEAGLGGWAENHALRRHVLLRSADLLRADAERLARMMVLEIGMPISMSRPHIAAAAEVMEYYAAYAGAPQGESVTLPGDSVIDTVREPVGVVGVIVPWNFPFKQAARKLAPAIAVGCTTVVKPSPYTNACTLELIRIIEEAGAPPGVVNLVPGTAPEIGAALAAHPGVNKISFTGSTRVGVLVLQAAAATVKRVSLELGGKNPAVVLDDADLEAAANGTAYGMFLNSGQACGSVSRLLVHESVHGELVGRLEDLVAGMRLGDPASEHTSLGPLVSTAQEQTVLGFIERARRTGLDVRCGGTKAGGDLSGGYFVEPTIVDDVPADHELAQHEVFGPVLAITPFASDEEAVTLANGTDYGLTAAVWSRDHARALRVAHRIDAGTVWINDNYQQNVEGIWGGYKRSGLGRELGVHGLLDMTEVKEIYSDGTGAVMKPHYRQVLHA